VVISKMPLAWWPHRLHVRFLVGQLGDTSPKRARPDRAEQHEAPEVGGRQAPHVPRRRSESRAENSLRREPAFEPIAREVGEAVCAPLIGFLCQQLFNGRLGD
jgi:hypothetical protein